MDATPLDPANLVGQRLGRFQVGRRLGSGGAATVYQAYDLILGRTVALKVLLPGADAVSRTRFRQEAQTAGGLQHPHIVRTVQVGDMSGGNIAYIAMELVEGESLANLLDRRGRLSPEESCNLLEPIARALALAHRAGIVHRDVKPSNILLRPAQPGGPHSVQLESLDYPVIPLLSDFGIARALDTPDLTNVGRTIGTPAYMAPEQCAGSREVDGRADIYALGAVLYRCLVGRAPFVGSTTQILHAHVYDPLTIPDAILFGLPAGVVEILKNSLAKDPAERYPRSDLMAAGLARAAGRLPVDENAAPSGADDHTATMTLAALPAVQIQPNEPRTATVLVPARRTAEVTQTPSPPPLAPTPAPAKSAPPSVATPGRQGMLGRLERVRWSGLAVTSVLLLLVVFFVVALTSGQLGGQFGLGGRDGTATVVAVNPFPQATLDGGVIVGESTPTPSPQPTEVAPSATPVPVVDEPSPTPVDEPSATPSSTATATPEPTATPVPPTATPLPLPSPSPSPSPTATVSQVSTCSITADPFFLGFLNTDPKSAELGCADNLPVASLAEIQPFQNGAMLRREDTRQIYVRYANQRWTQRPDGWQEGDPLRSDDPRFAPPGPGLFQPERGFGRLWESDDQLRSALGWATAPATPFNAVVQSFNGGVLIGDIASGQVYVFLRSELLL